MNIKKRFQIATRALIYLKSIISRRNFIMYRRNLPINDQDHAGIARAITQIENGLITIKTNRRTKQTDSFVVVLIGNPGSGKSTLLNMLITKSVLEKKKVAVLMLDPRSKKTGGSFLGDRLRLNQDFPSYGVYMRSMSFQNQDKENKGKIISIINLFGNLSFDIVYIETVGQDQNNTYLEEIKNKTIAVFSDSEMDWVQTLKSDNIELADYFFINKKNNKSENEFNHFLDKLKDLRNDIFDAKLVTVGSATDMTDVSRLYDRINSVENNHNE